jgi:hypothetical protein
MTMPFTLPAWVPWWIQLATLVVIILVAGAFLLMPFSVFGLKARIEALDQRLEDVQSDVRELSHRLPDPEMRRPAAWRRSEPDEDGYVARPSRVAEPERPAAGWQDRDPPLRPPIPPAPVVPERDRSTGSPRPRSEPQLRWPSEP